MNKLIAIVGMCGTGKSVVADYLVSKGYQKVYFGGITYDRMREQGIPLNESNDQKMREGIRKEYGMGAYAILSLPKIEVLLKKGDVLIDGMYSWTEYKILKEKYPQIITIAVTTPLNQRYNRMEKRPERPLTKIELDSRDYTEIENIEKGGPIARSDYTLINNSTISSLLKQIDNVLEEI